MINVLANDGIDKSAEEALKAAGCDVDTNHYEGAELIAN